MAIGDYAVEADAEEKNRLRIPLNYHLATRVQRVRMYGSAAVDLAWVAAGKTDACIMLSNKPWDTAAAREAGAAVVEIDGSPHTMASSATIAAAPKLVADLMGLIDQARRS
nr:inositol monophosphatase family protein [Herbidospora daliensis]